MSLSPFVYLRNRTDGVFYGWWLVGLSGFIRILATVPLFHAMGLWFVALESQFGWTRTQLSIAFAFTRVEGGVLGPVEGYLNDRVGTRQMVLIGMLILGGGFLLLGQVSRLWMFYLAYIVMALGGGLGGWLPLTALLNNWFVRNRTAAMGWSNSVTRLGGLFLIPAMAWSIDPDHDRLGWQLTATLLGIFTLATAVPLTRLIRNRPEDYNLRPDGDRIGFRAAAGSREGPTSSRQEATTADADFTPSQALRTSAFWFISFGHGFTSMVIVALMAHLAPMMTDAGFSLQTAAWVVTVYTFVSMVFQVIGGYVGDRVPKNVALFVFTCVQGAAVMVITFSSTLPMAYLFAVLFGIGFGGRNPLTTAIRGDYFGRASYGMILGISQVPMNVLLLIAPLFAGLMRDIQGTYTTAFFVLGVLSFLGGALMLMAKKPVLGSATEASGVAQRRA